MKATVKCSNCGAEITNLNMSWGKYHWIPMLLTVPIILLPMWMIWRPKGVFRADLTLSGVEYRIVEDQVEVVGSVANQGKKIWKSVQLDAEFYDADGKFLDEMSGEISKTLGPGETEHFKLRTCASVPVDVVKGKKVELKAKVADARNDLF